MSDWYMTDYHMSDCLILDCCMTDYCISDCRIRDCHMSDCNMLAFHVWWIREAFSPCVPAVSRLLQCQVQTWVIPCLTIVICLPAGPAGWAEQGIAKASKVSRIVTSDTPTQISLRLDRNVFNSTFV